MHPRTEDQKTRFLEDQLKLQERICIGAWEKDRNQLTRLTHKPKAVFASRILL